jgi:hypothetical protein
MTVFVGNDADRGEPKTWHFRERGFATEQL